MIVDSKTELKDCIITVVCTNTESDDVVAKRLYNHSEHDAPTTLEAIKDMFEHPLTVIVIAEDMFEGEVYKWGNSGNSWERTGETNGYA